MSLPLATTYWRPANTLGLEEGQFLLEDRPRGGSSTAGSRAQNFECSPECYACYDEASYGCVCDFVYTYIPVQEKFSTCELVSSFNSDKMAHLCNQKTMYVGP